MADKCRAPVLCVPLAWHVSASCVSLGAVCRSKILNFFLFDMRVKLRIFLWKFQSVDARLYMGVWKAIVPDPAGQYAQ